MLVQMTSLSFQRGYHIAMGQMLTIRGAFTGFTSVVQKLRIWILIFLPIERPLHYPVYHIDEWIVVFEEIFRTLESGYSIENIGYANSCLWHLLGTFLFSEAFKSNKIKDKMIRWKKLLTRWKIIYKKYQIEGPCQRSAL